MAVDMERLRDELTSDPRGYGFRALIIVSEGGTHLGSGTDNGALMDMLNAVRDGSNPPTTPTADGGDANGTITIRLQAIPLADLWAAIRVTDMTALPVSPTPVQLSTERRNLAWLTGLTAVPWVRLVDATGVNTPVVENLIDMFPAGSPTRARLVALGSRVGSRAEELFGEGTRVTGAEIAEALRG